MASDGKRNMGRAGTMQTTSKEGMSYLEKHLPSQYKHIAQLKVHFEEERNASASSRKRSACGSKKSKEPAAKKPKLTKSRTMAATAQEGALLLGNEVLGDTREMTKKKAKAASAAKTKTKRAKGGSARAKTIKAKVNKSKVPKKTRKPSLKKANTMVKTAKEGRAFIGKDGAKLQKRRCQKS